MIRAALFACLSLALSACGGGGGGGGGQVGCTATPSPSITSTPSAVATVGQQYRYVVDAHYACFPFVCRDVDAAELPTGAVLYFPPPYIGWTPIPGQANTTLRFSIFTPRDPCGNQATQSWTVLVLPDTVAPSVTAVWPAALASNVATDAAITVMFSEPLAADSVNSASFVVQGPGGVIAGSVRVFSSAVTFTPGAALPPSSLITVTVTSAVRDLSGNALPSDFSATFTTTGATPPPPGWTRSTVDESIDVLWTSIAVDAADRAYIAYQDGRYTASNQQVGDIKLAVDGSGRWQAQVLDNIAPAVTASLAALVDAAGAAHVAYFDFSRRQLRRATNASGSWQVDIVARDALNVTTVAMTADAAGRLHVVYNPSGIVTYATSAGGAWTTQAVASNDVVYGNALTAGIALDGAGKVHIVYYDYAARDLRHTTNASGSWVSEPIDSQGDVGLHVSIASDAGGKLHVGYYDATNGDLKYATNVPGTWRIETIDGGGDIGVGSAIALDGAGAVHLAYVDATNHTLKYATNAGGAWVALTIDNAAYVGAMATDNGYPAIAVDSRGKVHISYRGGGLLRYATNR